MFHESYLRRVCDDRAAVAASPRARPGGAPVVSGRASAAGRRSNNFLLRLRGPSRVSLRDGSVPTDVHSTFFPEVRFTNFIVNLGVCDVGKSPLERFPSLSKMNSFGTCGFGF